MFRTSDVTVFYSTYLNEVTEYRYILNYKLLLDLGLEKNVILNSIHLCRQAAGPTAINSRSGCKVHSLKLSELSKCN